MKMFFILFFASICFCSNMFAQEKILVSISPMIGTEIDREERDRFNWFPEVPNYISARFYLLSDETYEIQIRFFQNGQINEQNRVITAEAFQDNYQSILEPKKTERNEEKVSRRRSRTVKRDIKKRIVHLRLSDSAVKNVEITDVESDSIGTIKSMSTDGAKHISQKRYAITDIENISVVRKSNPGVTLGIGIAPGVIASLFTYGNLKDDHYEDDSDEKARRVFYLGEIIGLSVSGTITAMRSVDYDYVFTGLTDEQKKEKIYQFVDRGIRKKANVRISPWVGIYDFPNYIKNKIIFPGLRFSICPSPRNRIELMFGYSKWAMNGDAITTRSYGDIKEYTRFILLKFGFRTDLTYHKNFNPFIAWGWGILGKRYNRRYEYEDYYYSYADKERNVDIIISMDFGLEHHFNKWVSLETRISLVENIDYGLHYMGQIGLQLGRFY